MLINKFMLHFQKLNVQITQIVKNKINGNLSNCFMKNDHTKKWDVNQQLIDKPTI